jgi:amidase
MTAGADGLCDRSATELASLIARREVSAREVVAAYLARIEARNPELHALVQVSPSALDEATRADEALARGEAVGPLHGVPFTVKDWIETAGLVCAAGIAERVAYVPQHDATVVARMREAGAILLGKTNVGDGTPVYPAPVHPLDPSRTPGASSSGEAVAIAAGLSPLGLASDSGGSIRWPAHCTGVAGLKPTNGLVPLTGHFPRIGHLSDPRTAIGPMARSVADLEATLHVIAGEDGRDPSVAPVPARDSREVEVRALRVGWFTGFEGVSPSTESVAAVHEAALRLRRAGATVSEQEPPRLDEAMRITEGYWARVQSRSFAEWDPPWPPRHDAEAADRLLFEWERFSRSMAEFMAGFDVLLSPAAATAAPEREGWGREQYAYTVAWSLTRQPVVVLPVARDASGLPIGVQVIARVWHDDVALAAARAIEAGG